MNKNINLLALIWAFVYWSFLLFCYKQNLLNSEEDWNWFKNKSFARLRRSRLNKQAKLQSRIYLATYKFLRNYLYNLSDLSKLFTSANRASCPFFFLSLWANFLRIRKLRWSKRGFCKRLHNQSKEMQRTKKQKTILTSPWDIPSSLFAELFKLWL